MGNHSSDCLGEQRVVTGGEGRLGRRFGQIPESHGPRRSSGACCRRSVVATGDLPWAIAVTIPIETVCRLSLEARSRRTTTDRRNGHEACCDKRTRLSKGKAMRIHRRRFPEKRNRQSTQLSGALLFTLLFSCWAGGVSADPISIASFREISGFALVQESGSGVIVATDRFDQGTSEEGLFSADNAAVAAANGFLTSGNAVNRRRKRRTE
jgi:hypothetical protein